MAGRTAVSPRGKPKGSMKLDLFGLGAINDKLDQLLRKVTKMAVDQATFDEHLTELATKITDFIAAVEALLAKTPVADFTAEDTAVQEASANLKEELEKITPPAAE